MCEEVWSIWMLIYFCMHLTCFANLAFVIFKIINFLAFQALQVCQWLSIDVMMLKKPSAEFLMVYY
jgi:hypothetical protein